MLFLIHYELCISEEKIKSIMILEMRIHKLRNRCFMEDKNPQKGNLFTAPEKNFCHLPFLSFLWTHYLALVSEWELRN